MATTRPDELQHLPTQPRRVKVVLSNGPDEELELGTFAGVKLDRNEIVDLATGQAIAGVGAVGLYFPLDESLDEGPYDDAFIHPV